MKSLYSLTHFVTLGLSFVLIMSCLTYDNFALPESCLLPLFLPLTTLLLLCPLLECPPLM